MGKDWFTPEMVSADAGRRIVIPKQYCEKISWVRGEQNLHVWLLSLVPGRFRLLSNPDIDQDTKLREVRTLIEDGPSDHTSLATEFDSSERAALVGRLIPTILSPHPPSWRLTLPEHIIPDKKQRTFVLMFSLGYAELWFLDTYNVALSSSLNAVI
jgi:hypothetical protein